MRFLLLIFQNKKLDSQKSSAYLLCAVSLTPDAGYLKITDMYNSRYVFPVKLIYLFKYIYQQFCVNLE